MIGGKIGRKREHKRKIRFRSAVARVRYYFETRFGGAVIRIWQATIRTWCYVTKKRRSLIRHRQLFALLRYRLLRRLAVGGAILMGMAGIAVLGLWWRLSNGPIDLDLATPWLKAAIERNFGGDHVVSVGGTQIERDEQGNTSLRLRDIVVRDREGAIVASAPKAEVGISGSGLLSGQLRAESLNLVGAELSVRIETDGRVTIFAGADKRPIATAVRPALSVPGGAGNSGKTKLSSSPLRDSLQEVAGIFAWLDNLGTTGLDGHDLRELGVKDGHLVVEDQRNGKQWTFDRINATLGRPKTGGITFSLQSEDPNRPWLLNAAMRPLADGVRAIGIEARKVSARDIALAARLNDGGFDFNLPISVSMRADILADGTPQFVQGQLLVEAGTVSDRNNGNVRFSVDQADFRFDWDIRRHNLIVPFRIQAGGNQFTLRAMFEVPRESDGEWLITLTRGDPIIDPIILGSPNASDPESFTLNRVNLRARLDIDHHRINLEQGDIGRSDTRPSHNMGVAFTGSFDWSQPEPHLTFGVAGARMPLSIMKGLWPAFVAHGVRSWINEHISSGAIERIEVAGNAPLASFSANGPSMSEEDLSIDVEASDVTFRPLTDLPPISDADLSVHITGTRATVAIGRGTADLGSGRKLSLTSGFFEIPNMHKRPTPARAKFRIDGTLPAAVALLSSKALRDQTGIVLDPANMRGAASAQILTEFEIGRGSRDTALNYTVDADLTNVAADRLFLNQKIEAAALKVMASKEGYWVRGDVKIDGTAATVDLRKRMKDRDGELYLAANIDDAARRRLGFDLGSSVTGSIPVKLTGRFGGSNSDGRFAVQADLTPVNIENLFPGWVKPAGGALRAQYILTKTAKSTRFDDLHVTGSGVTLKGSIEIDNTGDIVSAHLPIFSLSKGDRTSLRAERGNDRVMRVMIRGDVYDGRNFVKSSLAGTDNASTKKKKHSDLDLDIKLGLVAGYNGETLRGLDLKLSRRDGAIRSFSMNSKIGRDSPLSGDLRVRVRDNHQVIYFATDDAGAFFRFTDMYPRMFGGQMWMAMDPPTLEQTPQAGTLSIRDFVVRGEPVLNRIVADAPDRAGRSGVEFNEMSAEFTRFPGKMAVREGVVRGPVVGVTVEGQIDHLQNDVHLRGTFVPLYGLNNIFGQIPVLGEILGGGRNEGLLGITYEAVGPPSAPRITVNPVTAIAPGLLRKFIPSRANFDPKFAPPAR